MMATMFLQIKLNPTPPDPIQAKIMMIMPLVFGGMMFFFPAGLVLYWCVNNAVSIAQQRYIMYKLDKEKDVCGALINHPAIHFKGTSLRCPCRFCLHFARVRSKYDSRIEINYWGVAINQFYFTPMRL